MILWKYFWSILGIGVLLLEHNSLYAQNAFEVELNIDMEGVDTSNIEGTFALHAQFRAYAYSAAFKDTLLKEITILPTQWLSIPPATLHISGHYLKFTPRDSLQSPKIFFFQYHYLQKDTIALHLNSYFFNQPPPALFAQMQEKDTLTFFSKYSGNAHEMMLIPSYSLHIVKQGTNYKAFYQKKLLICIK
ncbi:MAG: hypothetical protein AB8E82_04065 [Aureispira sp.]